MMAGRATKIAKFHLPRLTRLRSAAYTYAWTEKDDRLLPDHYKKHALEFLTTDPKPVHWIPDERKFKPDKHGKPIPVQNVPIPVKYPQECNEGLWGGEGIVQGFVKKKLKSKNLMHGFRCPKLWLPKVHKEILYSEILDQWMTITVTKRTLNLIDEVYGLDHYILGTSERDLNSRLGMKLKREMLLALARKSMYPNDPKKREMMYERYKKYEIPFAVKQERKMMETPTSFTRITSISSSSDEDFSMQYASMYEDNSHLVKSTARKFTKKLSGNQCVPNCDSDLGSRSIYYSEFINDHHHLSMRCENDSAKSSDDSDMDEIPFPRIVEGCEDSNSNMCVKYQNNTKSFKLKSQVTKSSRVSSTHHKSDNSRNSMHRKTSISTPRASSTICRKPSISTPRASSTMIKDNRKIDDNTVIGDFIPKASSTMVGDITTQGNVPCVNHEEISYIQCGDRGDDLHSIYMWSIQEDESNKGSLEELYLQRMSMQSALAKPPLPPRKYERKVGKNLTKQSSASSVTRSFEPMSGIESLSSCLDSEMENVKEKGSTDDEKEFFLRTSTRVCLFKPVNSKSNVPNNGLKKGLRRSGGGIFKKQNSNGNNIATGSEEQVLFQEFGIQNKHVKDKQTVMRKLKRFSKTLLRKDSLSSGKIQTLANL